jgi:hypothetical protein
MNENKIIELPTAQERVTPEQALKNIDQACSQLNTTRKVHAILSQSIKVLRQLIKVSE